MEAPSGWHEHARLMDSLVTGGVVVIGGPDGDGQREVLVCPAESPDDLLDALASDPWRGRRLVDGVEGITIRLGARRS